MCIDRYVIKFVECVMGVGMNGPSRVANGDEAAKEESCKVSFKLFVRLPL